VHFILAKLQVLKWLSKEPRGNTLRQYGHTTYAMRHLKWLAFRGGEEKYPQVAKLLKH
jgi:hypothetical protein